jgi:nitrate/nitrite transport system substrate-binding protein
MNELTAKAKSAQPGSSSSKFAASIIVLSAFLASASANAAMLDLEKDELKFGFIKLTDMAPLAIAYEKGFFEDEGLFVTLEAQSNWKVLLDGVIAGELDGAHMLSGQPLAATIGYGTTAHLVTPFTMDLNGNAITVSNEVWDYMLPELELGADGKPVHPIPASALATVIEDFDFMGRSFNMGMVFPVSTHNYELRYWLAAGGIRPGYYSPEDISGQIAADVFLSVTPPPQMPATLEAGTIDGYAVGEPWNQAAVAKGIGVPVVTDFDIFPDRSEKVFGITAEFAERYPNTTIAITKALIRAAHWLDENDNANRMEAVEILSQPQYVGADVNVIAASMTGTFEYEAGDVRDVPDFNVFFRYHANYPFYSDAVWYLTQMRRWGQIAEDMPDEWYAETAASVYRPDLYLEAARLLVEDGLLEEANVPWDTDGYREPVGKAIDGLVYDGRSPNAYIDSFPIGLKSGEIVSGAEVIAAN